MKRPLPIEEAVPAADLRRRRAVVMIEGFPRVDAHLPARVIAGARIFHYVRGEIDFDFSLLLELKKGKMTSALLSAEYPHNVIVGPNLPRSEHVPSSDSPVSDPNQSEFGKKNFDNNQNLLFSNSIRKFRFPTDQPT